MRLLVNCLSGADRRAAALADLKVVYYDGFSSSLHLVQSAKCMKTCHGEALF